YAAASARGRQRGAGGCGDAEGAHELVSAAPDLSCTARGRDARAGRRRWYGAHSVPVGRALGARVIGAVGDASKATLAKRHGCHQVLVGYEDLAARVRTLTRGAGVHVVYDGVGRDTFQASLDSLRARGMMVAFGNASGAVEPVAPLELMRRGSLFLTRPTAGDYLNTPEARRGAARALFGLV